MSFDRLRRRDFITLLGGAAAAWPLAAQGQQPGLPVIGYLSPSTPGERAGELQNFSKGLSEMGYVDGRNVAIEFRWAQNDARRLPELAADLVRRQVAVIVAVGGSSAGAVKALTSTIPIVFGSAFDPVAGGLVASLNRPGGNVTGVVALVDETEGKRLGLLHELLPRATRFAVLGSPQQRTFIPNLQAAAQSIGVEVEFHQPRTSAEIDATFADLVQKRTEGLVVESLFLFRDRRTQILTLTARHAIPAIYGAQNCLRDTACAAAVNGIAAQVGIPANAIALVNAGAEFTAKQDGEETRYSIPALAGRKICRVQVRTTSVVPATGDRASLFLHFRHPCGRGNLHMDPAARNRRGKKLVRRDGLCRSRQGGAGG